MGDNRNVSNDSRNRSGHSDTRYILGKAELVLFPFRDLGLIR
ncbi:MAG: hypothetical protein ACLT5P_13275 [Flavonifractor plautii]